MNLSEQLNEILNDLQQVSAESTLMLGAILLLIVGLISSRAFLLKTIFSVAIIVALYFNDHSTSGVLILGSISASPISIHFSSLFLRVALLILIFRRGNEHAVEFYFFILAMLVGSIFMMKANSLLIVYLAIETVSLVSYILTNFSFKKSGFEAGIKYLLFGAISSAVMLFGLGLIYGSTGTFLLSEWNETTFQPLIAQVGFVMMLFGFFFKISIVPSHIWVPATYQSAPADAVAFMSVVPKIAGLVLLKKVFETSVFLPDHWVYDLTLILGIATIIIGTLGAFRQTNARRVVSFGAIAHSGFLLPFALINTELSDQSFWYYSVIYALMNLVIFFLLDSYERKGINELSDYSKTKPEWIGVMFSLILVSLVGLPPLAGFMAKFFLFSTLWENYYLLGDTLYLWYLIVAVLATVGSLFFYLQIPKRIFLDSGENNQSVNFNFSTKIVATLFTIALLLLFFAPKLVTVMQQLVNNVHE
ncbi:MAG: NADH-quinone oxidoreductase subunit N [Ekhidna sp.]|uniref:NADH-quinone oxidoreductase subunit N n=1 Tax=Ekhidna sp. TaxID=2608089 RepID=UPI0032EE95D9